MASFFETDFFVGNRRRLLAELSEDIPVVLTANGLLQRNGDATYRFRQDSSFWYLTGIDQPDITVVIDGDTEYLMVPGRDAVREAFDGAVDVAAMSQRSGIAEVLDEETGWRRLTERLKRTEILATLVPAPLYLEQAGFYVNPARERLVSTVMDINEEIGLQDLRDILAGLRVIKQPQELKALRQAIDITVASLQEVTGRQSLTSYTHEYQAEAELTRSFRLKGSGGHAFEPIVVAGERACTLHNLSTDGEIRSGELLQFDVGAEYDHYAADISRVYAVGEPSQRQQAVHRAVVEVQDYAFGLLKPGVMLADFEKQVAEFLGSKLVELGLIAMPTDEEVRKYFPHATSHFLGLDVHDSGLYKEPLAVGMVVTCEPGIYIPEEGIGIRIEDDVLITDDGHENLSAALSRDLIPAVLV